MLCAEFSDSDHSHSVHPPIMQNSSEEGDDGSANLANNESSIEEPSVVAGDGDEGDESENDNNSSLSGTSSNKWMNQSTPLIEITEAYDNGSALNDEKIYEDLCYVTFSPNSREVLMIADTYNSFLSLIW
jgi:hypothetical protein